MEWRSVIGFEGLYEVSDAGLVRSVARTVVDYGGRGGARRERSYKSMPIALHKPKSKNGRVCVTLKKEGKATQRLVSHLVAFAFLGPRPDGHHIAHNDGNLDNNSLANLRYATPKENAADKLLHGTQTFGEQHHCSKLTHRDVSMVCQLRDIGYSSRRIKQILDLPVSSTAIRHIMAGRTWNYASK